MRRRDTRRLRPPKPIVEKKSGDEKPSKDRPRKVGGFYTWLVPSLEMPGRASDGGNEWAPKNRIDAGVRSRVMK